MSSFPTTQALVFTCQAGALEAESSVLAASLRKTLGEEQELIAAIPGPPSAMGQVSPSTLDFLASLRVQTMHCDNPLVASQPNQAKAPKQYFLTNKIFALREVQTDAQTIVFLDSDQICHAPFDWALELGVPFLAPRVGHVGANAMCEVWEQAFRICDTEPPKVRIRIPPPENDGQPLYVPPWFNTGFVAIGREWVPEITSLWLDCFQRLDGQDCLGRHSYFTEQLALAIAVAKSGILFHVADPGQVGKSFLHYFSLERLAGLTSFVSLVRHLVKDYPSLESVLGRSPEWTSLLGLQKASRSSERTSDAVGSGQSQSSSDVAPIPSRGSAPAAYKFLAPSDVKQVTKDLPWMSLPQAEFLTQHLHRHRLTRCLELGILHGVSTCYIAAAVQRSQGHVVAIDLAGNANLRPGAEELLESLGLLDSVTIERVAEGATWVMMEWLERRQQPVFDFVYVDVAHTWDITGFLFFLTDRFVRPGGWILFDDIRSYKLERDPVGRRAQNYTQKQLEICQVGKVWDLLVTQHPGYSNFSERGNWGLCQKVR